MRARRRVGVWGPGGGDQTRGGAAPRKGHCIPPAPPGERWRGGGPEGRRSCKTYSWVRTGWDMILNTTNVWFTLRGGCRIGQVFIWDRPCSFLTLVSVAFRPYTISRSWIIMSWSYCFQELITEQEYEAKCANNEKCNHSNNKTFKIQERSADLPIEKVSSLHSILDLLILPTEDAWLNCQTSTLIVVQSGHRDIFVVFLHWALD